MMKSYLHTISFSILTLLFLIPGKEAVAQCPNDSLYLVALHDNTNGPGWTTAWDLTTEYATWPGVTVDVDGCVTSIILPSRGLDGTLPTEIGSFAELDTLILSGNGLLTGAIPATIGGLANLTYLDMSSCGFDVALPDPLGSLSNLEFMFLQNNAFGSGIPTTIGGLTALRIMNLSSNSLTGNLPPGIGGMGALESLNLSNNSLDGTVIDAVGNLSNLDTLNLSQNQFTGAISDALLGLSSLRVLCLNNNFIEDIPAFALIPTINTFKVENNRLDFGDLEPNVGINFSSYEPQDSIASPRVISICEGGNLFDTLHTPGQFNVYSWYRYDGGTPVLVSGPTTGDSILNLFNIELADEGIYVCHVTNNQVTNPSQPETNITLYSHFVYVDVIEFGGNTIGTDTTICEGDFIPVLAGSLVDNPGLSFTYLWQQSEDTVTWTDAVTTRDYPVTGLTDTTYFRRLIQGDCDDTSNVVQVNIVPRFEDNTITGDQDVCFGLVSDSIIGTPPAEADTAFTFNYTWQYSFDSENWADTATTISFGTAVITDTIFFRRIITGGCEDDTSNVVQVNVIPPVIADSAFADQIVCYGEIPNELSGSEPTGGDGTYTYYWQELQDTVWVTVDSLSAEFQPDSIFDTTAYRRVVKSACNYDTSNVVTIYTAPDLGVGDSITVLRDSVCFGDSIPMFTGTMPPLDSGFFYVWEISQDSTEWISLDSTQNYVLADTLLDSLFTNIPDSLFVRRQLTDSCRTYFSNVLQIRIFDSIRNNIIDSIPLDLCITDTLPWVINDSLPTGGTGNFEYQWQVSFDSLNWGNIDADTSRSITFFPLSDTTYFRRVVIDSCFTDTSNVMQINLSYLFGDNIIIPNDTVVCRGDSLLVIEGTPPSTDEGEFSYRWQASLDTVVWFEADTSVQNYVPDSIQETTYYRRIVEGGCEPDTSEFVKVEVIDNVQNNLIRADQRICQGDSAELITGTVPIGYDSTFVIRWEYSTDSLDWLPVPIGGDTLDFQPWAMNQTTYFRRLVQVIESCSPHISDPVLIEVVPFIENNFLLEEQNLCRGDSADTLRGSLPTGGNGEYTYLWQEQAAGDSTWTTVSSRQDYGPGAPPITTFYRRIVTSECFSDTSDVLIVFVSPLIPNNVITGEQSVCLGVSPDSLLGTVILDTLGEYGLFRYIWQVSDDKKEWEDLPNSNTPDYELLPLDTTQFYRRLIINDCFTDSSNIVRVRVLPLPEVYAGEDTSLVVGFSIKLKATGALSYIWRPAESLDDDSIATPTATPNISTLYIVEGTDINGCKSYDSVFVQVDLIPDIRVVDAITPNGDGLNEILHVDGIERYPGNTLIVFNRWGQEVYRKAGYENEWSGTVNGRDLPNGTYFYVFKFDITSATVQGSFLIMR